MAEAPSDFYEEDENLADLLASYDASEEDVVTEAPSIRLSSQVVSGDNMLVYAGATTFTAEGTLERSSELING